MTTTNTHRHPRSRAREVALQLLFQHDLNPGVDREEVARFAGEQLLPEADLVRRAVSLFDAVAADRAAIDERIGKAAENWRIQRMAVIDRNLIRLGAAEFSRLDDEPVGAVMNDVIELARAFGSADSPAFVNGVLDRMYREAKKASVEPSAAEILPALSPPGGRGVGGEGGEAPAETVAQDISPEVEAASAEEPGKVDVSLESDAPPLAPDPSPPEGEEGRKTEDAP